MALQDKVSQAWVNFAKTGNPSQPGLEWKPYTKERPAGDGVRHRQPVGRRSHDDKLVSLLPAARGRGGTAPAGRGSAPGWPASQS